MYAWCLVLLLVSPWWHGERAVVQLKMELEIDGEGVEGDGSR